MKPGRALPAVAVVLGLLAGPSGATQVAAFSSMQPGGQPGEGWQLQTFRGIERHTRYALVRDGDAVVVRGDADASAAGLMFHLDGLPEGRTRLAWRWKIAGVVADADPTRKDRDDFAARVYVTFRYAPERMSLLERAKYAMAKQLEGEYPPYAALVYAWDAKLAPGTVLVSPYSDRVRVIVLRSGDADAGRWLNESRDVLADYRRAFGETPPPASGVALMSDTDQTGGRATAWFGDVRFVPAP